tara:strand:+ start:172 stop:468 length:297 start_codon:yes stop_codon:yes gene_type:complete
MLLAGVIAAAGLLFLVFKLGMRKVVGYDILFDILITAVLMASLAGTYSGMMAALFGGLLVSVVLFIMKKTMHHQKLHYVRTNEFPYRGFAWKTHLPEK